MKKTIIIFRVTEVVAGLLVAWAFISYFKKQKAIEIGTPVEVIVMDVHIGYHRSSNFHFLYLNKEYELSAPDKVCESLQPMQTYELLYDKNSDSFALKNFHSNGDFFTCILAVLIFMGFVYYDYKHYW